MLLSVCRSKKLTGVRLVVLFTAQQGYWIRTK